MADTVKIPTTAEVTEIIITDKAAEEYQRKLQQFQERVASPRSEITSAKWWKEYAFDSMRKGPEELFKKWGNTFEQFYRDAGLEVSDKVSDLLKSIEIDDLPGKTLSEYIRDCTVQGFQEAVNAVPASHTEPTEPIDLYGHVEFKEPITKALEEAVTDMREGFHELTDWETNEISKQFKKVEKVILDDFEWMPEYATVADALEKQAEEFKEEATRAVKDSVSKKELAEHKASLQRETNRLKEEEKRKTLDTKQEQAKALAAFKADEWVRAKKEYYDYRYEKRTEGTVGRFFEDLKQVFKDNIFRESKVTKSNLNEERGKKKFDIKGFFSGLKGIFSSTSTKKLIGNLALGALKAVINVIMTVIKTAFNMYKSLFSMVTKVVFTPMKKLIGLFKSIVKSAMQHSQMLYAIQRILDTPLIIMFEYLLIPLLKVIIPAITKMIKFVVDHKDAILKWGEVIANFVDTTILQPILNGLNEDFLNNPIAGAFNIIGDILSEMTKWVKSNAETIGTFAKEIILAIGGALASSAELAAVIIDILGTALRTAIDNGLISTMYEPIRDSVVAILDTAKLLLQDQRVVTAIADFAFTFITMFFSLLGSAAGGVWGSIGQGLDEFAKDILGFSSSSQLATLPLYMNPATIPAGMAINSAVNTIAYTTNNYGSKSEMKDVTGAGAI